MADAARSQVTDRPNKRRAGASAGGLAVAESRPQVVDGLLRGARCTVCRHALSQADVPWCPACFGPIEPAGFTPVGTVWAATTVRIPVGRWSAPFGLAYVDVDDGPRVLVHVAADPAPHAGDRVSFHDRDGDLVALDVPNHDGEQAGR
ncbi:Zn-ribbon domain-containing OB-fold protein [uncultured Gordonia sp.]|uniref:Zn-ribbon domain-containing OB-fold protein n=1 Tax=uncultured Gordonia sp. TaxID=198437 RepID=UPI0025831BCA|nr:OB-fold domain-containing protein [uncultured Gordonia sp.]